MRFTKMHGAGNDYVYVDCFSQHVPDDPAELARRMAHRRFGVGGDGLILIRPSEKADARMQMFNADGSEAEMCGNGVRCVAKYVYDHGICRRESLKIETGVGVLDIAVVVEGEKAVAARVDMGEPILDPARIPADFSMDTVVDEIIELGGQRFAVTCVSMGNPHCIVFVDSEDRRRVGGDDVRGDAVGADGTGDGWADDDWVLRIGPLLECDWRFPQKTNVEFVHVVSPVEVRQRTWERGSGETWACGTGASAVCVAGVLSGRTERRILNHLLGGDLELEWNAESNHVFMTGPAVEVFSGEWNGE